MPASRSCRPGSPHLGAAAAPSALAVRASLRAVSLGRPSLLRAGPRPGSPGSGRNFCPAVAGGHLGRMREDLGRRQWPVRCSTMRPPRRVPTPATATRPGPRSAKSVPRVQRPSDPRAGPGRNAQQPPGRRRSQKRRATRAYRTPTAGSTPTAGRLGQQLRLGTSVLTKGGRQRRLPRELARE